MMNNTPLFKRMGLDQKSARGAQDWSQIILDSLTHVFNARQGESLLDPQYGLPEFQLQEMTIKQVREYERAFSAIIQKYEPRLMDVQVKGELSLRRNARVIFHVTGCLHQKKRPAPSLEYESLLTDQGQIMIRKKS